MEGPRPLVAAHGRHPGGPAGPATGRLQRAPTAPVAGLAPASPSPHPSRRPTPRPIPRIGIGGPVGSGKTALIEAIVPRLVADGDHLIVITNDVVTIEDAMHVRRALKGVLDEERVLGVETGACPHTAVREDPSMNLAACEDMEARFPDTDVLLIESGGDNLTLTFSPVLVDYFVYVIDVAAGDKIPRKDGPGITRSDLLVINKTDLAPYVGASLEVMAADSALMRGDRPFLFTNCKTGEGIADVIATLRRDALFGRER